MVDKDFRFTPDPVDAERERLAALAAHEINQANAAPVNPVEFFGKPEYGSTKEIKYTDDGRPISPRYDEEPEEEVAPKDSFVPEPVDTSLSTSSGTTTASVPGLEDVSPDDPTRTSAPVERDSGQPKVPSPGKPTSLQSTPTSPGSPALPVTPPSTPTQ